LGKRDRSDIEGVLEPSFVMPRIARVALGGLVFHVLNRGVARMQLFEKPADYQAFEQVLRETLDESSMRICAYTVMPNHWHLLLWPECDGELAKFMQRLTITHVRRWRQHRGNAGLGHVYQGRYTSFPVESDEHFWAVARHVERNPQRANLVLRAEEWRWSS
jgi:putative transposase